MKNLWFWAFLAALAGNVWLIYLLNAEKNLKEANAASSAEAMCANHAVSDKNRADVNVSTKKKSPAARPSTSSKSNPPSPLTFGSLKSHVTYSNSIYLTIDAPDDIPTQAFRNRMIIEPELDFTVSNSWWSEGYRIEAPFKPGTTYEITVLKGLQASNGAKLAENLVRRVVTGDYHTEVAFKNDGVYMASKSNMLLPVDTVNADALRVTLREIHSNNIVHYLRDEYQYKELSGIVAEREFPVSGKPNEWTTTALDLRRLIPNGRRGVFIVEAAALFAGKVCDSARRTVVLSDLGITAKLAEDAMLVWVNRVSNLKSVADAEVSVMSSSSQVVATMKTDSRGIALFGGLDMKKELAPFAVLVKGAGDANILRLDKGRINLAAFDTDGRPYPKGKYEAFIFSDRGVYRPGETVHIKGIARSAEGLRYPGRFPVVCSVRRPDGDLFCETTLKLDAAGEIHLDQLIPKSARTGRYNVTLSVPGGESPMGAYSFLVEDFVPDAVKVCVSSVKTVFRKNETETIKVASEYLFGAPAANALVSARCVFLPAEFAPPKYKDYSFTDTGLKTITKKVKFGTKRLNIEGKAAFSFNVPDSLKAGSGMRTVIRVSVRVLGGRAVTNYLQIPVDLKPYYIGVKRLREGSARKGGKERFKFVVVDFDGNSTSDGVPANLAVELHSVHWNWILKKSQSGGYHYISSKEESVVKRKTVSRESRGFDFVVPDGGDYRVVVGDEKSSASCSFESYAPWCDSFSKEKPDKIDMTPDGKRYKVGDTVRIVARSPFAGKALMTIENCGIRDVRVFDMSSKSRELKFKVRKSYGRNFYCSLSVLNVGRGGKGSGGKGVAPVWSARAFGVVSISLDNSSERLTVSSDFPEKTEPGKEVEFNITVAGADGRPRKSHLTLALVDEGILSLTGFETPDPFAFFYAKRPLTVETSDIYSMLMPEFRQKTLEGASPSGGGARLKRKYLSRIYAERVRNAVVWMDGLRSAENGVARVKLRVPDGFNGALRLMLLASDGDKFGSYGMTAKVAEPVMILPSASRFLAPNDEFVLPVEVFNRSGAELNDSLVLTLAFKTPAGAYASFAAPKKAAVKIPDGNRTAEEFVVSAPGEPGVLKLTLSIGSGKSKCVKTIELPVRPPNPYAAETGAGIVQPSNSGGSGVARISISEKWEPGTSETKLVVSESPFALLKSALENLDGYPYGCVEQTTSKAFPMLYLASFADPAAKSTALPGVIPSEDELKYYLASGIARLRTMQLVSGGFSMWPGGGKPFPYGGVYATHFLVEARKAGCAVDTETMEKALTYLKGILGRSTFASSIRCYAAYVLALAGKNPRSWALRLFEKKDELSPTAGIYLALAMRLMRDPEAASELLFGDILKDDSSDDMIGGVDLASRVARRALFLSALLEINPDDKRIPDIAAQLIKVLGGVCRLTTHESAFALMALGKYFSCFSKSSGAAGKGKIVVLCDGGRELTPAGKGSGRAGILEFDANLAGKNLILKSTVARPVYYSWTVRGVPSAPLVKKSDGIAISRTYFSMTGEKLDPKAIPYGGLVLAEIAITALTRLDNVVLSDLLPAGLEVENANLATRAKISAVLKGTLKPDHVERRDDRLLVFTSLPKGKSTYKYILRAVAKGRFALPPVSAECMYAPAIGGNGAPGSVVVLSK
ncbi:MAG: alpha-2-macroglobulin family protein [Victivallales bacterium]|nr:alpha-2-macroglobulin family protein [Victivallales bacterium]